MISSPLLFFSYDDFLTPSFFLKKNLRFSLLSLKSQEEPTSRRTHLKKNLRFLLSTLPCGRFRKEISLLLLRIKIEQTFYPRRL